jgi:hypothetical protein
VKESNKLKDQEKKTYVGRGWPLSSSVAVEQQQRGPLAPQSERQHYSQTSQTGFVEEGDTRHRYFPKSRRQPG